MLRGNRLFETRYQRLGQKARFWRSGDAGSSPVWCTKGIHSQLRGERVAQASKKKREKSRGRPKSAPSSPEFPLSQQRKEVIHVATIGDVLLQSLIRRELETVLAPPANSLAPPERSVGLLPPARAAPPAGLRESIAMELARVLAPPASSLAPPERSFGLLPPARAAPPAGLRELIHAELANVLAPPASSLAPPAGGLAAPPAIADLFVEVKRLRAEVARLSKLAPPE